MADGNALARLSGQNLDMLSVAIVPVLFAQDDFSPFLGENFWPWMVLALGAAMVVGNVLAVIRPPAGDGQPTTKPPIGRTVVLVAVGLAASAWGLGSLVT